MSLFPAPVSGQPIPRGWFARLVRFINSLVLHGDGSYTQVRHTNDGTFVTLTPAAIDALNRASGRPGGGSGSTGFPNLFTTSFITVDLNNTYPLSQNMWLIGRVQGRSAPNDESLFLFVQESSTSTPYPIRLLMVGDEYPTIFYSNFICLPLRAGYTISFTRDNLSFVGSLILYPAL